MASQQPSGKQSIWDKTKKQGQSFFEKAGTQISNKLGAEAFWPTTLDKESDKAARILRSFCIDGFMADQGGKHGHEKKEKSLDKIPPEVGLADVCAINVTVVLSQLTGHPQL